MLANLVCTGFNILLHVLVACLPVAFSSPSIASNKIPNPQAQLKGLDSYVNEALIKITKLRLDPMVKIDTENAIVEPQTRKCNDVESMLKALDEDTKEIQIMQLRESKGKNAAKPSKYVESFRKIEYLLRDIASKLRKLAKSYKITGIPKYTVGLSRNEVTEVQNKKLTAIETKRQAYQKLTAMGACIQVFRKEFIAYRLLWDPVQSNKIYEFIDAGQQYDLNSNDVF